MIRVCADDARYRIALAELTSHARSVPRMTGALAVISGSTGWVDAAVAAARAGASGIVVARPGAARADDLRRLQDLAVPVVIERTFVRPDLIADALADRAGDTAPRIVLADGGAESSRIPVIARDAVGWMRMLAGGDLRYVAGDLSGALMETDEGIAASVSIVPNDRLRAGWLRLRALGEVTTRVDLGAERARITTDTTSGQHIAPARFESSARLTLRRALAIVAAGDQPGDVPELLADTLLVERLSAGL